MGDVCGEDFVSVVLMAMVGGSLVELDFGDGPEVNAVGLEVSSDLVDIAVVSIPDV